MYQKPIQIRIKGSQAGHQAAEWCSDNLVFEHSLEWLIERAKGTYAGTINEKEGIIIRPRVPKISPSLNYRYLSTKCNNPNYNPKVK